MRRPSSLRALPPRETAVGACARSLRESILSGELAVGSRLPPERELAATFGVNRLTLRSALGQVAAAGLVTVRQGSGYVVRDFVREGGPDLLPGLVDLATGEAWREAIADLLLVRRVLARAVLERLQPRIDEAGIARLERAVDRYEAAVTAPGATSMEKTMADQEAIRALIDETGSKVLSLTANPVFRVIEALPVLQEEMFADPAVNVAGFRLLLAVLRERKPDLVERLVEVLVQMDETFMQRLATKRGRRTR